MTEDIIRIKEFNLDKILPNNATFRDKSSNSMKIVICGKPGSGKSKMIETILYSKKHIIPVAQVLSGSESTNKFFSKFMPSTFIFDGYSEEALEKSMKRQKIAKEHL